MNLYHTTYINSPLNQFNIQDFFSFIISDNNFSFTNMDLYLSLSGLLILFIGLNFTKNNNKLIGNNWLGGIEALYATILNITLNQINSKNGQKYFPFIFALFIFILINNLYGMVPYSFATTSHFIITFFFSFTIVLGATILGFMTHKLKFFSLLVPSGCPLALVPLLVFIEFISYLARNVSLGLRLAANILAGHMLLNILAGFTFNIMNQGIVYFILCIIPLLFIIAFSSLEIGIAFIQAQVFVVLTSGYIKDSLELH